MNKVTSINQHFVTVVCLDYTCGAKIRVGRILNYPYVVGGPFKFCALCGHAASVAGIDVEETYIETMAHSYNFPVPLMEEIFKSWDAKEYPRFKDYVEYLKKEVMSGERT